MSGQIFISYRREESRWSARSLHDRLCRDFDPKQIFMDIDAIALGEDFVQAIETTVAKCDVLVAVIGNNWLASKDDHGDRRLENPEDFVRMEIGVALKREIRVIPVLVDGVSMPLATALPEDLKLLVRRNALRITDTSFDGDCQRLVATIRQVLEKAATEEQEREKSRLDAENREREERQREEAEKSEAQRQDNERLVNERREKDRLEAERLEVERRRGLEAEQRQRESASKGNIPPPSPAPSQDRGPAQAGTPLIVQRKSATISKAVMLSASLVIFGVVLIVGLIWFFGSPLYHSAQGAGSGTSTAGDYYNQGLADLKTKDYDKAINEFNEAIIVDPKYAQAYLQRGTIYLIQGHTAEARADFDRAKQLGYTGSQ